MSLWRKAVGSGGREGDMRVGVGARSMQGILILGRGGRADSRRRMSR